jgi:C-terminal processing protease CtpA/Prc
VQVLVDLPDGAGLKVSMAQYLLPDGTVFEGRGIDVDVELVESERGEGKEDPAMLFAQQILIQSGDANRTAMLKAAQPKLGRDARVKTWRAR